MHVASNDRPEFIPPPAPGRMRAIGLAVLAHLLLLAALTWGVNWRHDASTPAAEAELWSAVPQEAAPPAVTQPEPEPEPKPEPAPESPPVPHPPKADPGPSQADIALAREKERKAKEKLEQQQRDKEKREKEAREKERLEREKQARLKQEQDKKFAEEKKKKELEAKVKDKLKAQQETQKLEKLRQENLQRMAGLAGASGSPSATGSALKSSGPSASYAGRIVARVKPNIVFTEDIVGNPSAEVEVRCAPDGTIVGRKLIKSSGSKAWDDAILKAIDKTEVLPRDTDGRVPSTMIISFRPRD